MITAATGAGLDIACAPPAVHCMGATIPRSGHGFLRRVLRAYFGKQIAFCVTRKGMACCNQLPCTAAQGKAFWYQKSHDLRLKLDNTIRRPWLFYLVQERHPLPQILSYSEFRADQHEATGRPLRREDYVGWLAAELVYRRRFTRKWLVPDRPDILVLRYEDLTADPAARIGALLRHMTGSVDMATLERAVARESPLRKPGEAYRPREIGDSRHFDHALHGVYEAIALAESAPGPYRPVLGHGPVAEDHPLVIAYRTRLAAMA